jgi:methylisocitrate lyase
MSKCRVLHNLILQRAALQVPGVYDALSAKLAEQAGFKACQISGFAVAASLLGLPGLGIASLRDQIGVTQAVCQAVRIPVMADGDTGYGNAVNAMPLPTGCSRWR